MQILEIFWSQWSDRSSRRSKATPPWGVETNNKDGFKDIVKAADDFASRVGSGKGVDKDKIHKGEEKGYSSKEKDSKTKGKSKGNPKGNAKGNSGKPEKIDKTDGKGPKHVVAPDKTGEKNTSKDGKKSTGKSGSKGQNNGDKDGGKAKKVQK